MPPASEALSRYKIIDGCLTNAYRRHPTMEVFQREIERSLNTKVSAVTIQKDIALMKKSLKEGGYGAPIRYSRSTQSYYYDLVRFPNFTIQALGLNEKEIEAIELAAGVLKQFKGIKVNDTFNHAIDKLFSAMNMKKLSGQQLLVNAIQPEEITYVRGMEHFDVLVSGIKQKVPLSFVHYSYNKKRFKTVLIHPYLLKESNRRWYLVGFSEEHKQVRNFGLDRIYDPVFVDMPFKENSTLDLRFLFENKIGLSDLDMDDNPEPESITLKVDGVMASYVKSMPLHKSQTYEETGSSGEITVSVHLIPTDELLALLLSYGHHIEVLSPTWLRMKLKQELESTILKYKQTINNG